MTSCLVQPAGGIELGSRSSCGSGWKCSVDGAEFGVGKVELSDEDRLVEPLLSGGMVVLCSEGAIGKRIWSAGLIAMEAIGRFDCCCW